jgi:hypothetical protein
MTTPEAHGPEGEMDTSPPTPTDPEAGRVPPGHTGHPRVDDVVAMLDAAAYLPPADQVAPLTEAHRTLRETLDSIGDG